MSDLYSIMKGKAHPLARTIVLDNAKPSASSTPHAIGLPLRGLSAISKVTRCPASGRTPRGNADMEK
jgi:hypothetical protein